MVFLERSLDQVVALAAILKAGAAYVPLDAEAPSERTRHLMQDTQMRLVITRQKLREQAGWPDAQVSLDRDQDAIAQESTRGLGNERANEAISLLRLARLVVLGHPASLSYFVATGPDVCGYACLNAVAGLGDVQMIAMRSDRRGEGIGTALLDRLLATATARGCREVFLYVRADNPRARELYRRTRFTETGVRPGFYQPSGTDAIVMRVSCPARAPPSYRDP